MDSIRNIISNLYIYKFQNNDNQNLNKVNLNSNISNINESISNEELNEEPSNIYYEKKPIINYNKPKIRINQNLLSNNTIKKPKEKLDNYNRNYIAQKNSNFFKNEVNYVSKNKEILREQQHQMKELKMKKEIDALHLLLSYKTRNSEGVRPRLYDYELKQQKIKKNLIKKGQFKIRNFSSQKPEKNYYDPYNQMKSVKLPMIKPSSSPLVEGGMPLLHKDYGRMPEYLERRKKELQEQKELNILKQKEKNLPKGCRIMPEKERQERLEELKSMKKELENELYQLPIARLSKKQIERKDVIERSLFEIDEKMNRLVGYKEVITNE